MTPDPALLRHLGPRLVHVTAAANVPSIMEYGLHPAATLAGWAGSPDISLRDDRLKLKTPAGAVTLNHQRPILRHLDAASRMVDGYNPRQWARQLDGRVFLSRGDARFAGSIAADLPVAILQIDTRALLAACGQRTFLSPINSGNFTQGGARARRGDWIYVPAHHGLRAFRENRRRRGLVKTADSVKEVSVIGPVPPDCIAQT